MLSGPFHTAKNQLSRHQVVIIITVPSKYYSCFVTFVDFMKQQKPRNLCSSNDVQLILMKQEMQKYKDN